MFAIISWNFLFFVDTRKTNVTILSVFIKLLSSWQFKMVYLWLQWLISHHIYDLWFSQAFEIVVYNFYHFLHLLKPFLKCLINPQGNKILKTFFNKTAMEFKATDVFPYYILVINRVQIWNLFKKETFLWTTDSTYSEHISLLIKYRIFN